MIYLFIDTSIQEEIRVAIFDDNGLVAKKIIKVGFKYSEKLLTSIDSLLRSRRLTQTLRGTTRTTSTWLKQLKGVLVVEGPGRFSALRTGVSVANTLAWSLGVSVVGIPTFVPLSGTTADKKGAESEEGEEGEKNYWQEVESIIVNEIKKLKLKRFKQAIIPQYGQEPNITIKK